MVPAVKTGALSAVLCVVLLFITPATADDGSGVLQRLSRSHTVSGLQSGTIARFRERKSGKGFYIRYGSGDKVGSLQVYEGPLSVTSAELRDSILAKIMRSRPRRVQTTVLNSGEWASEFGDPFATVQFKTVHTKRKRREVTTREVDEYLFARSAESLAVVVRYSTESAQGTRAEAEKFATDLLSLLR